MKLTRLVLMILAAVAMMAAPQPTAPAKAPAKAAATKATSAALADKRRPYRGKNELLDRKILAAGVFNKVKNQIIARQK